GVVHPKGVANGAGSCLGCGESPTRPQGRAPIRRSITVLIAVIAVVAVAVPAFAASTGKVNLPHKFRKHIPKVKEKSGLPVLLPERMWVIVRPSRTFPAPAATENSYTLELDAARGCNGANACFLAQFTGTRGGEFSFK